MKLVNPDDSALNAAFAEKVAGWRCFKETRGEFTLCITKTAKDEDPWAHWNQMERDKRRARYTDISCMDAIKIGFFGRDIPNFTQSADAVLPWLEKWATVNIVISVDVHVTISETPAMKSCPPVINGDSVIQLSTPNAVAKAAVIALLRAHGVEVEFAHA